MKSGDVNINQIFIVGCTPEDISTMKTASNVETIEDFLNGESYDLIIEEMWLMLNYISPYCTTALSYSDNYWSELPLLLKKEFLYPLKDQWY